MKDTSKLPKWAQDEVAHLQRRIAERDAIIQRLQPKTSRIRAGYNPEVLLPDFGSARFHFPENQELRFIDVSFESGSLGNPGRPETLYIMGSDSLVVRPGASNTLFLTLETRPRR